MTDACRSCDVDGVIITDELDRRPSRPPEYEAEVETLSTLARELAQRPGAVLQRLTDLLVAIGKAESAGVSILEGEVASQVFRWVAVSGAWAKFKGGTTSPFDASPCGAALAGNRVILMEHPQRAFPGGDLDPHIHEMLLAPVRAGGKAVGTLWISAHGPTRKFDREDARCLERLADFASAGFQAARALDRTGTSANVEELSQLQRHSQSLLSELQHRVRNTLSVVRSMTRRTASTSESVEEMAMHLEGRIGAFSRVQAAVTRHPGGGVNLAALIREELLAHAAHEGDRVTISGPEISFRPRAAESLSLAIHELATNSVKYGALSGNQGRLKVRWQRGRSDEGEILDLFWEEYGLELGPDEPRRKGFGLELLERALPYELEAETHVDFGPQGLRFHLTMALKDSVLERDWRARQSGANPSHGHFPCYQGINSEIVAIGRCPRHLNRSFPGASGDRTRIPCLSEQRIKFSLQRP